MIFALSVWTILALGTLWLILERFRISRRYEAIKAVLKAHPDSWWSEPDLTDVVESRSPVTSLLQWMVETGETETVLRPGDKVRVYRYLSPSARWCCPVCGRRRRDSTDACDIGHQVTSPVDTTKLPTDEWYSFPVPPGEDVHDA